MASNVNIQLYNDSERAKRLYEDFEIEWIVLNMFYNSEFKK